MGQISVNAPLKKKIHFHSKEDSKNSIFIYRKLVDLHSKAVKSPIKCASYLRSMLVYRKLQIYSNDSAILFDSLLKVISIFFYSNAFEFIILPEDPTSFNIKIRSIFH
jgi:hypothetical protein